MMFGSSRLFNAFLGIGIIVSLRLFTIMAQTNESPRILSSSSRAKVNITSVPNTTVFMDGVLLGTTPYRGSIPAGEHRFRFVKEGYQAKTVLRSIGPAGLNQIDVPIPSLAELTVTMSIDNATLLIDGTEKGTTPITLTTESGKRRIRIEREGFAPFEKVLTINPAEPRRLQVELEPVDQLKIEVWPKTARIILNGHVVKEAVPESPAFDEFWKGKVVSVPLEAGSNRLLVSHPDAVLDHKETIKVREGAGTVFKRVALDMDKACYEKARSDWNELLSYQDELSSWR